MEPIHEAIDLEGDSTGQAWLGRVAVRPLGDGLGVPQSTHLRHLEIIRGLQLWYTIDLHLARNRPLVAADLLRNDKEEV